MELGSLKGPRERSMKYRFAVVVLKTSYACFFYKKKLFATTPQNIYIRIEELAIGLLN